MNRRKILCLLILALSSLLLGTSKYLSRNLHHARLPKATSRMSNLPNILANTSNNSIECRNHTIDEFPGDFLTLDQKRSGGILIHMLITVYLFCAVAIVCDEYFVHSLTRISKDLNLKDDVAGATFMAAGSSAPELFTSLVGVIIAKSDVGTGTIVGSAVFNVLFIIAVCAFAAKSPLRINWYPLTRDSLSYLIAVSSLLIVLYDGRIHWYESACLLSLYVLYILIMYFNQKIERYVKLKIGWTSFDYFNEEQITLIDPDRTGIDRPRSTVSDDDDEDGDQEPINPFKWPAHKSKLHKAVHIILLPINLIYFFTIPDCRRRTFRRFPLYFVTFIMSTVYLGLLTYVLVWMIVIISYTFEIPDTIAGLTILAAGTSIPEVVSSIIVVRKGKGEMAISNSLGSNIFDILVCLGLPWFVELVLLNQIKTYIQIYSAGIFYSTAILLASVFVLVGSFIVNRWYLNKKLGAILILLWCLVTVLTCLFELNIIGNFSLPFCQ